MKGIFFTIMIFMLLLLSCISCEHEDLKTLRNDPQSIDSVTVINKYDFYIDTPYDVHYYVMLQSDYGNVYTMNINRSTYNNLSLGERVIRENYITPSGKYIGRLLFK